ncbi:MAG: rhomboid family intramembrane serine protease [Clostridia bacterium]|nr:rhomboid family intramembrane serine protease [Clostridia bacterium]
MKKLQYNSPVILTFFLVSFGALLLNLFTGGWSNRMFFSVYRAPLTSPFTWVRMFTHVLGHAGVEHFLGNMLLLLVVGPPLEEKYGSKVLLTGILFTALVSGLLQTLLFPGTALLGASGIVFMLIMLSSLAGMKSGQIPLTLILVAVLYLGQEIHSMLFIKDNVANFMHLVGGGCGTAFGFAVARQKKV